MHAPTPKTVPPITMAAVVNQSDAEEKKFDHESSLNG
jgi:hypothetical protein